MPTEPDSSVKRITENRGRVRRLSDERREELLRAGIELFGTRSFDDVSIDEIASSVGISRGLLYHYFPSKRDFYVAGLRRAADDLVAAVEPAARAPLGDRLVVGVDAYLGYVEGHARGFVSLMRGGIGSDAEVREIVDGVRETLAAGVLEGLAEAGVEGPTLRLAVRGWIGFVEAVSLEWLERREPARAEVCELARAQLVAAIASVTG
jgi:AcrR family transcriptional regulator